MRAQGQEPAADDLSSKFTSNKDRPFGDRTTVHVECPWRVTLIRKWLEFWRHLLGRFVRRHAITTFSYKNA
jgi:hypothetical protein